MVNINYENCIVCGVCIDNCNTGALELIDGITTWAHPELCENCGVCIIVCPEEAISLDE